MSAPWDELTEEVSLWQSLGWPIQWWWRDDDANHLSPELSRLLQLAGDSAVPLALAIVPLGMQAAAFDAMPRNVEILQHGADHLNRGGGNGKKTEFPESEPVEVAVGRLLEGRLCLEQVFGERALPVLVPPWNRFPAARIKQLAAAGYNGISTFQPRQATFPAPGLRQVNTHVDIINWRAGRGFVGETHALEVACAQMRMRRLGQCDVSEPLGWLTHHAVHDEATWSFLARLFERTRTMPGLRWLQAGEVFAPQLPHV